MRETPPAPRPALRAPRKWLMVPVLCLAFALRVPLLDGPRFHPDEALFASFARSIAVWRDPLLTTAPVDKPPLLFYLQALCYPFLGPKEMAARAPNLFASLLTVALTYAVACRVICDHSPRSVTEWDSCCVSPVTHSPFPIPHSPLVATLLVALSPLAIAFGPTAFTDSLMVMWGMAALLAACRGRAGWAGFWLGLGLATKYQAIFFLPLVVGFLWLRGRGEANRKAVGLLQHLYSDSTRPYKWVRLGGGALLPVAAVMLWDLARTGRVSLLAAQLTGYGGVRPVPLYEIWPRLLAWASLGQYVTGSAVLDVLLLAAVPLWLLAGWLGRACPERSRRETGHSSRLHFVSRYRGLLLAGWLLGYFLIHWLLTVNVWDRYLLPAVPVMGVLIGWLIGVVIGGSVRDRPQRAGIPHHPFPITRIPSPIPHYLLPIALLVLLLPGAVQSATGVLPIGGDHGNYDGIEQVAEYFSKHPYGTVLYDHWLSWELRYYLFDSRVHVSWSPDPAALATNLQAFGADPPRYLVVPSWESPLPISRAMRATGFDFDTAFQAHRPDGTLSFTVYQIGEPGK